MDLLEILLFIVGIILCLIPLNIIQDNIFVKGVPPKIWTLLVPLSGILFIGAALISYHKTALGHMFFDIFHTLDQTGAGLGFLQEILMMNNPKENFISVSQTTE
jgi:uncharacterized membrane protein YfbV (UPF0208 family)